MADELDATRATQLPPAIIFLITMVLLGVALELAVRWLSHRPWVKHHRRLRALLYDVRWQPLLWSIILGLHLTLPRAWIARISVLMGINPLIWLAIIAVAVLVVRALSGLATRFAEDRNVASTSLLEGVVHALGLVVIVLIGLGLVGVPVDGVLLALAGSSVGIGLALQQPLTNLFAGLLLSASDRFRPGELIRLSTGQEGRVADVDWLTTTIKDSSDSLVAVPNVSMMTAIVVNFDRPSPPMVFSVPVAVSRTLDLAQVERVTLDVATSIAQEIEGVEPGTLPGVSYALGFDDYVVRFNVTFRITSYAHQAKVRSALVQRLEARYLAEGITMFHPVGLAGPFPVDGPQPQRERQQPADSPAAHP